MGTPFHADISVPPGSPAGEYPVFDPSAGLVCITHCRVSTDTAQRVVVGVADADGSRVVAGWLPAGGAGILADLALFTGGTGMAGQPILLFTSAVSGVEVQIEGEYAS